MHTVLSVGEYYADPEVRRRVREYLGVDQADVAGAVRVAELMAAGSWPIGWETARHRPIEELEAVWADGADLARSLRDRRGLLFFIELDYENPDAPGEPFLRPAEVFRLMEPVYQATCDVLARFGLRPLTLMSGRGYHFTGRIPAEASVSGVLARLVPGATNGAWAGLGCVVEHAAHLVLRESGRAGVPVVVNGLPVGKGPRGRAAVSIDFSYGGDPLDVRFIRCAFGTYQWHRFRPDIFGVPASEQPPLVTLPRDGLPLEAVLSRGRTLDAALRLAARSHVEIPDVTAGVEGLTADYLASPLAAFHRRFHADLRQATTRDLPADLPPCVLASLRQPNDLLLKPEHLQHLVRSLLSRGWEASQVASLVHGFYEADHGWGDRWQRRMDPVMRADFEARVFGGLVAAGTDGLVDFNCVSAQEKGLCPRLPCSHDLRLDRDTLRRRMS